jgi:hypothetical protein
MMACMQSAGMFSICTDANHYTANATSIDVTINNYHGARMRYEIHLQLYDGVSWINTGYTSGHLLNYVVKKFALAGQRQGNYRLYGKIRYDDEPGIVGEYYTPSFRVDR